MEFDKKENILQVSTRVQYSNSENIITREDLLFLLKHILFESFTVLYKCLLLKLKIEYYGVGIAQISSLEL